MLGRHRKTRSRRDSCISHPGYITHPSGTRRCFMCGKLDRFSKPHFRSQRTGYLDAENPEFGENPCFAEKSVRRGFTRKVLLLLFVSRTCCFFFFFYYVKYIKLYFKDMRMCNFSNVAYIIERYTYFLASDLRNVYNK